MWWDAMEFEMRGTTDPVTEYWDGLATTWGGNLPGKYREWDEDDVTHGCASPHLIDPASTYYAYTSMVPLEDQPTGFSAFLESELGYDYGGLPPIPQDWENVVTGLSLPMSSYASW